MKMYPYLGCESANGKERTAWTWIDLLPAMHMFNIPYYV